MNRYNIVLVALYLSLHILSGQTDSVFQRKEGLYLDYIQFRENKPVTKQQILSNIDTNQLDFFTKVVSQKEITINTANNEQIKFKPNEVWGYFQNGILYIYYDNTFYKVPVLGAISYFIGTQEVTYYSGVGMGIGYPYGIGGGVPVKTREMKEFLLDYYTGKVYPFSIQQLEELLKKDNEIYTEFSQLSNKQKRKKYSYYIRKFNEKYKVE